jgi:hypothetical protein
VPSYLDAHLGCSLSPTGAKIIGWHRLDPLDLYVRYTSAVANAIFSLAVPWIAAAHYDRTLKLFPSHAELS